ncbi:MAG: hypothetical protein AAF797_11050 [Planctomycetota bacterium]
MSPPTPTPETETEHPLRVEPDTARPDALESLRHPAYFGAAPTPEPKPGDPTSTATSSPTPTRPTTAAPPPLPPKSSKLLLVTTLLLATVLLLVAAAAGLYFSGYLDEKLPGVSPDRPPFAVDLGEPLPAFRGYLLDPSGSGPLYTSDDTVGKPLVIAVWSATDEQTPAFLRAVTNLAASEDHQDTTFLGLVLDSELNPAIDAVAETGAFTWQHLYNADARQDVASRPATVLDVSATPALYSFDALGRLRLATTDPAEIADAE